MPTDQVVELAARNLQVDPEAVIATSALKGTGLEELIFAVIKADPKLLLTIAHVMPRYRLKLAQRRAMQAATEENLMRMGSMHFSPWIWEIHTTFRLR